MGLHHAPLFLVVILGSFLQTTQGHLNQTFTHGMSAWIKLDADETNITVKRCQYADVLLECNCSKGNRELKWQKDEPIYLKGSPTESYKHRIETFLNESSTNCSILLKNITEEDGGEYLCSFDRRVYSRNYVTLQVDTNSTECQVPPFIDPGPEKTRKDPSTGRPEVYFAFIIIPALLLLCCIFAILRKRRRNQLPNKQEPAGGCLFATSEHLVQMF